jgi:hypothetical protein
VFVKFWYVLLLVWLLLAGLTGNKDKPILKLVSSFHYEIGVWFLGLFHGPIAVCTFSISSLKYWHKPILVAISRLELKIMSNT